MKKVTIKDIALISGVSRGTVDRVINDRGNVAEEVQKKVLKIANDLGYEKNILASTLASNKEYKIGIVCPDPLSDPFWVLPREGIESALSLIRHYGIKVEYFDYNLSSKEEFCMQLENALKYKPDAILIAPVFTAESLDYLEQAQNSGIPFITINTEIKHGNTLCYIGQNSYHSGYLAGRLFHLRLKEDDEVIVINLGHHFSNSLHYSDKLSGIKAYFNEYNLNSERVFWYEFDQFLDEKKLQDFWNQIKANHPKMKALFFTNSRAFRIVKLLSDDEVNKLDIVGFDMIEENVQLVKDNKIDFIINQNPIQQGYLGVMNFVNHFIHKSEIQKVQYLPLDIVLKENMEFYINNKFVNLSAGKTGSF